jgi:hypothetical protein
MRIGNSKSDSYRRLHARRSAQKRKTIKNLCERLDKLVEHAESFKPHTKTSQTFMKRADKVREKLKVIDH